MERVVLVIEDEPSLNRAVCALLAGLGECPVSFPSAEEAWSHSFLWLSCCDCAFIDVTLPGASGLDFAHRLRDRFPHLPIIITSGLRGIWSLDALEPVCYMTKPFGLEELQQALCWKDLCYTKENRAENTPEAYSA